MSIYKWTPIAIMTPLLFRNFYATLIVPWVITNLFDHYFERFFLWRFRKQRVINLRNEFITKLSKPRSKIRYDEDKRRRLDLFEAIHKNLGFGQDKKQYLNNLRVEVPLKFIKFGEFTEYIFHAFNEGQEQSSILQTTFFENYLSIKHIFWNLSNPSSIW